MIEYKSGERLGYIKKSPHSPECVSSIRRIEKGLFMSESVLNFLEEKNLPEVTKKKHTYLMMDGHDQEDIYVLKDGVYK